MTSRDIDYSDIEAVMEYYHYLCSQYLAMRGARGVSPTALRDLHYDAAYWLKEVEELLTHGPIVNVPCLLEPYDMIHRFYHHAPATDFCDTIRRQTFQRWLGGERSLTATDIMLLLWPMVSANFCKVDARYRDFCMTRFDSWMKELLEYGRFRGISESEAHKRLAHILSRDLYAYIPGGSAAIARLKDTWSQNIFRTAPLRSY